MTSLSLLRARLSDAETRAFASERSLRRSRAEHRKTRLVLGNVLEDLDAARHGGAKLARVLRRLAARHLGEGAARADVDALIGMWMAEDPKQETKDTMARLEASLSALDRAMQRLFGEDDDNE